tara:strand:- start:30 stop:596 length:567 start_codon:yes stop_codon:yes gene_type:complete
MLRRTIRRRRPTGTPRRLSIGRPMRRLRGVRRRMTARDQANQRRTSKNIEQRVKQAGIDRGRIKGTKSTVGDKSVGIEQRMKALAAERKRNPSSRPKNERTAAYKKLALSRRRKAFNDRMKKQIDLFNKRKKATPAKKVTALADRVAQAKKTTGRIAQAKKATPAKRRPTGTPKKISYAIAKGLKKGK